MSDPPEPTLADVLRQLVDMRVAVKDRIDRLQDGVTGMRDEQTVLLGLLATTQKQAARSLTEARLAVDQHDTLAQTMALLEMQVRRLRTDVDDLRERA